MALKSRILEIAAELEAAADAAALVAAGNIAERAKARVPVDSGRLRDAIHVEAGRDGALVVAGDKDAFYGHMVEHGTTHSPPQPFLVPAFEQSRGEAVALIAAAVRKVVEG